MAAGIKYSEARPTHKIEFTTKRKRYEGLGYDGIYFTDDVPEGKYDYYARHRESDLCKIESIKENKGVTVNFWGTVVLDKPIDFGDDDEVIVSRRTLYMEDI